MKIFLLSLMVMHISISWTKPFYLIIHGTWCRPFSWHMPGGDFYDALIKVTDPSSVSFFIWSANNSHDARMHAAQQLVDYIAVSVPKDCELTIIAHSHGCNVGFLACQLMAKNSSNTYRIHRFYALGAPINMHTYMPNMSVIHFLYNLFSFNDFVQPVFGFFEREFSNHPRIMNLLVFLNNHEPTHTELHSPLIAQWLPYLSQIVRHPPIDDGELIYQQSGIIHFWSDKEPTYMIDTERINRRERDAMILSHMNNILRTTKIMDLIAE